jgi:hypothetical protein
MKVKWKTQNKNLKPDIILNKIDSIKTILEDGRVSYSGIEYNDAITVLHSMVNFPKKVIGIDKEFIISKAVNNIAKTHTLSAVKVMEEINSLLLSTFAKKPTKYHLLTSISFDKTYPAKNIQIEDCRIRIIENEYPKKYTGRDNAIRRYNIKLDKVPKEYAKLIVDLTAKSSKEAARKALRVLDIQRAFWCIFGNSDWEMPGAKWSPINQIRLGGAHTIHTDNGKVTADTFFYEQTFIKAKLFTPAKPAIYTKNCNWSLKQLNMSKYGDKIKEALLLFVRALDEYDPNVALIRLWGAIESLANPNNANYDLVTRRCAFLFHNKEYDYHKQILEHLREYRNSNIHAGDENARVKTSCYQLQVYFKQLIFFHLQHVRYFDSLEQANNFLDLPKDISILENKKKLIEKAIQFRTG